MRELYHADFAPQRPSGVCGDETAQRSVRCVPSSITTPREKGRWMVGVPSRLQQLRLFPYCFHQARGRLR